MRKRARDRQADLSELLAGRGSAQDPAVTAMTSPEVPTPSAVPSSEREQSPSEGVPRFVQLAAGWSWRLLVIAAAVALLGWVSWQLRLAVFPLFIALMLASLLAVPVYRLRRAGWPHGAAAGVTVLAFLSLLVAAVTVIGGQVSGQFTEVGESAEDGLAQVQQWLADGPLHMTQDDVDALGEGIGDWVRDNQDSLTTGAVEAAIGAVEFFAGLALTLFALFFFLYDGDRSWAWLVRLAPKDSRARLNQAGRLAFGSLVGYVRGTVLVATFDSVFITIILLILGIPLALPLGVLVFLGAFVPLVGAFVSGTLAVLVALVTNGLVSALLVLAGIIVVQQLEGHVFQPLVIGKMVRLHPLVVVLSITVGALVAGILGAIVAVPIAAVAKAVGQFLADGRDTDGLDDVVPGSASATLDDQMTRDQKTDDQMTDDQMTDDDAVEQPPVAEHP